MNYYNEHDPKAAAWLRELIKIGIISNGIVDERDIQDVKHTELKEYDQCHFFAGVGGWSIALRLAGINDTEKVWTGSCPCQPFSIAGRGLQANDERHLWPDFRNLIGKRRPAKVFGEQVASPDGREWLDGVSSNLEALAYRFCAADLCAAGVGAPHPRQRLYWMADTEINGLTREQGARSGRSGIAHGSRMGHTTSDGCVGNWPARQTEKGRQPESKFVRQLPNGLEGSSFDAGGLVQSDSTGRDEGQQTTETARYGNSTEPASSDGVALGDTHSQGLQGHRKPIQFNNSEEWKKEKRHRTTSGFWSDYEIVGFTDGKQRRIESGTFPLADGVSGRVGLLRGYGNAIVPQVAAQFIKAALNL